MKILKLKFKNINSLSGENEIDFTRLEFSNNGLFAITGKTGAGKSSILDAITLALYGKTPRVDITANENDVMTRGEKDCYAEVIFEVGGKKWKSSWKQERTRAGVLKPVNRLIANFDNKIIADQVKACNSEIVRIIGLTFEQFTKVIMLAQGSFAAFLQADKNQKGELLEQITGTEIYAAISKAVFERSKLEQETLNKISNELDLIKILSVEEKGNLIREIKSFEKEKAKIDEDLQKLSNAKKWLIDLMTLETQISAIKENLPSLKEKAKITLEKLYKTEKDLKNAKEELKTLEPIFKEVRILDARISEKDKLLNPILDAISKSNQEIKIISNNLEKLEFELEKMKKELKEKQQWLLTNKKYEDLITNYAAIENENQSLIDITNEIKKLNLEIDELNVGLKSKKLNLEEAIKTYKETNKILVEKEQELETKKLALSKLLDGKSISDIQSEKIKLSSFELKIKNLIEVENSLTESKEEITLLNNNLVKFNSLKKKVEEEIHLDIEIKETLEHKINLLDENIKLTKTIQSLEEFRKKLEDGKECPLCGSLEHPFAKGNIPEIGEKEKELLSLKKDLKKITEKIQRRDKDIATLIEKIENAYKDIEKEEKKSNIFIKKQQEIILDLTKLNSTFKYPTEKNKIEKLYKILNSNTKELNKINKLSEQITDLEKLIVALRDKEIPELQKEKEKSTKSKAESETNLKVLEQELKIKQGLVIDTQQKFNIQNEQYKKRLEAYGVKTINELKKCLDSWKENKDIEAKLSKDITFLEHNIQSKRKELKILKKHLGEKKKESQDIETEKLKLSQERKDIFGEKSVEEEEKYLNKKIETLEVDKQNAEKEKNGIYIELQKSETLVSEKEDDLQRIKTQKLTDKTIEEIDIEITDKKNKSDEYSQKIGANKQALKVNEESLKAREEKLKAKERQAVVNRKWSALNNLIGSADGKKYRNFAQALTFEHLIGLSNIHLKKMSDRYLLKRTGDFSNPFELSVIDKYQNGEERTAQNLSGGEKFIVSLSLALGLSSMASKNMRIDTLFIDEGFGTLDSDYLDVALNALSNLQSEGKIIGVISHISELKERIATHIEVIPYGNGHSKIEIKTF